MATLDEELTAGLSGMEDALRREHGEEIEIVLAVVVKVGARVPFVVSNVSRPVPVMEEAVETVRRSNLVRIHRMKEGA